MRKRLMCLGLVLGLAWALLLCGLPSAFAAADEGATQEVSQDAGFGLTGFSRLQVGSNKTVDGAYAGYVYATGEGEDGASNAVALALQDKVVVYVPAQVASDAGLDMASEEDTQALAQLFESLDASAAKGGVLLGKLGLPYVFTTEGTYEEDGVKVSFGTELGEGYFYAVVNAGSKEASRASARFCDSARLLPASQIQQAAEGGWVESAAAFLSKLDMRPLWVSLKTAFVAMIFIFLLGLLAAWKGMNVKSRWKSLLDSVFTIPMVLPPTVCGFLLLLLFGKATPVGQFLIDHGISLVFTWQAAVISAVVVGFPLMYRTALGAFEALDVNMLDAARTLGWSEGRIFGKLMLPLAWPSIAAGTVLAFARAMGEFGATLFFAGNYAGVTQTMPIAIYFNWMGGNTDVALFWVVVVIVISFIIIMFINLYSAHATRYRQSVVQGGGKRSRGSAAKRAAGLDAKGEERA